MTSAAASEIDGNDAYSNDSDSMSYKTMFEKYGMSPAHVSVHIDNYKSTTNITTLQGKANLDLLTSADVVYFNGGDQSRHIRSWLNDDGSHNQLLLQLKSRAFANETVVVGTSAGSMIWGDTTFGSGSSFGVLYFKNSIGLAPKNITDASL